MSLKKEIESPHCFWRSHKNVAYNTYSFRLSSAFLAEFGMTYLNIAFLGLALFILTCVLCILAGFLLQVSPLLTVLFIFLGTLVVVVAVDILQAHLFG
jgi:hypothetical protein